MGQDIHFPGIRIMGRWIGEEAFGPMTTAGIEKGQGNATVEGSLSGSISDMDLAIPALPARICYFMMVSVINWMISPSISRKMIIGSPGSLHPATVVLRWTFAGA